MATIPIGQLVQINPGVLSAAGNAVDLNGAIITDNDIVPYDDALLIASAADAVEYFGAESDEARAAQVYFNGYDNSTKKPGALYFFRHELNAVAAYLRSGSLRGMTIGQLNSMTGDFSITVDGSEQSNVNIDLSAVTSFSEAAQAMEAALTGVSVSYDGRMSGFTITSATTGTDSSVSYASGELAESLKLTQQSGALQSEGASGDTPLTTLTRLVNQTQNFAGVMTIFEPELEDEKAIADWVNGQGDRYFYAAWDTDIRATQANSEGTLGAYLRDNDLTGTVPIYSESFEVAAFVLGFAASLDFERLNGRATAAWKSQSGLAPDVTTASTATALTQNGYNFYGVYANAKEQFNLFQTGRVSGQWDWLDTYLNQIWLNANLQLALVTLLQNQGSVPYNSDGDALIYAACMDPIQQALNFGAIRTGVQLSEAQAQQVNTALGVDARQTIQQKGFYLQTRAASTPASVRVERGSPSCTLYYMDGGSIQSITLASIAIQ